MSASPLPSASHLHGAPLEASFEAFRSALPEALARSLLSGAELAHRAPRRQLLPTAVPPLDRLLQGGLPRGALVEVVAGRSAGRFSLGLAALSAATRAGEAAALVDLGDHLDPQAATAEGIDLRRLLWVRPCSSEAGGCFGAPRTPQPEAGDDFGTPRTPRAFQSSMRQALAATETLLSAGFALVVLDLGLRVPRGARQTAAWLRVARAALVHDAAFLVLSPARVTGSAASVVLSAGVPRAVWSVAGDCFGVPLTHSSASSTPLLEGLNVRLTLEKRTGERPGLWEGWWLRATASTVSGPAPRPSERLSAPHALPARRAARA